MVWKNKRDSFYSDNDDDDDDGYDSDNSEARYNRSQDERDRQSYQNRGSGRQHVGGWLELRADRGGP